MTYKTPEQRIEPSLDRLEAVIKEQIGSYILYENNLICIDGLNVWALERFSEFFAKFLESPSSSLEITKYLRQSGLEAVGDLFAKASSSQERPCCPFHNRLHAYEYVKSGSATIQVYPTEWIYNGVYIRPEEGKLVTNLAEGQFLLPLFSEKKSFFDEQIASRVDTEKKVSLENKIEKLGKTLNSCGQVMELLEQLKVISDKYGVMPFFDTALTFDKNPYHLSGRRYATEINGMHFLVRLASPVKNQNEVEQYGKAIIEFLTYLKEKNPKISLEKTYTMERTLREAEGGLDRIKAAKPLFEEYHKTFQRYLDAGDKSFADF